MAHKRKSRKRRPAKLAGDSPAAKPVAHSASDRAGAKRIAAKLGALERVHSNAPSTPPERTGDSPSMLPPGAASRAARPIKRVTITDYYKPFPRQDEFHKSKAKYRLFGGAAGPGKTKALLWEAIRQANEHEKVDTLLLRRTFPELESSLISYFRRDVPRDLYRSYNDSKHVVTWNNGSTTRFGYSAGENDIYQYQGAEFLFIGIDELTLFTLGQWQFLTSRNRCAVPGTRPNMAGASNPGNIGHAWVKALWVDKRPAPGMDRAEQYDASEYDFIRATLDDNPIYKDDARYRRTLEALPRHMRQAFLLGDWNVFAGQYFDIFSEQCLCRAERLGIESWWPRWISIDWGFEHPSAVYWHAAQPGGGVLTYREFVANHLSPRMLAQAIAERSITSPVIPSAVPRFGSSAPGLDARGQNAPGRPTGPTRRQAASKSLSSDFAAKPSGTGSVSRVLPSRAARDGDPEALALSSPERAMSNDSVPLVLPRASSHTHNLGDVRRGEPEFSPGVSDDSCSLGCDDRDDREMSANLEVFRTGDSATGSLATNDGLRHLEERSDEGSLRAPGRSVRDNRRMSSSYAAPQPERITEIYLSPDAFAHRTSDSSIAEQLGDVLAGNGLPRPTPADDDRVGGWMLMYQMMEEGKWTIADSCTQLIECIPTLVRDPANVEDVHKMSGDDAADSARYGLKSRLSPGRLPPQEKIARRIAELDSAGALDPTSRAIWTQKFMHDDRRARRPTHLPSRW